MTGNQLRKAGVRIFGKFQWADKLARYLEVHRTTIYRWANEDSPIPASVEKLLTKFGSTEHPT